MGSDRGSIVRRPSFRVDSRRAGDPGRQGPDCGYGGVLARALREGGLHVIEVTVEGARRHRGDLELLVGSGSIVGRGR